MARPGPKKKNPTKFDRLQVREDVKTLFFQGRSLADAARIMGVEVNTAKTWSAQGRWSGEIQRIEQLASQKQPIPTTAQRVAFDLASTNRQTRSLLARAANSTARCVAKMADEKPEAVFGSADKLKALTGAAAQISGDWEETGGPKFAVAINLREMARQPGMIRELTAEEMRQLEEGGVTYSDGSPYPYDASGKRLM